MAKQLNKKKIIWAVDAFEKPGGLQKHAARAVRSLSKRMGGVVEPVYVLSPAQLNLSIEFSTPWIEKYRPAAQRALDDLMSQYEIPDATRPMVIVQNFSSTLQAVTALSNYAYFDGAEMIVVSSHGRSGVRRLLLGSFAETLLFHSKVPVVVINPEVKHDYDLDRIIFPTEFGKYARSVFRQVVTMAKNIRAEVTLFHAIPNPIEPVFQSGVYLLGGSWVPVHTYFAKETERQKRRADAWARWAKHQGVKAEAIVDTKVQNIADAIVGLAKKKKSGLIALEAQSGPFASAVIGSITREVVRHAGCPVWVIRSDLAAKAVKPVKVKQRMRRAA